MVARVVNMGRVVSCRHGCGRLLSESIKRVLRYSVISYKKVNFTSCSLIDMFSPHCFISRFYTPPPSHFFFAVPYQDDVLSKKKPQKTSYTPTQPHT